MKTKIIYLALALCTFSNPARAETCVDLKTCAKLMFDFKGQRYIWDAKGDEIKFSSSPDVEMTKENAELVFTSLLDHVGLARLPVGDGKTYRIMRNVMLKEIEAPVIEASAEKPPVFPYNTWDWVTMRYRVKSAEAAPVMESTYRLHLPREARMQADENAGLLIVTGTIPMVRQMYETLKAADRPLTAASKEHFKQWRASMMAPKEASKAATEPPKK